MKPNKISADIFRNFNLSELPNERICFLEEISGNEWDVFQKISGKLKNGNKKTVKSDFRNSRRKYSDSDNKLNNSKHKSTRKNIFAGGKHFMKAITFLIVFCLISLMCIKSGQSQVTEEWATEILPPLHSIASGNAVAVDNSGNVYTCGNANNDMVLVKHNRSGDTLWTRIYDNGPDDRGHDVTVDNSGNIYVTGPSWGRYGTSADAVIIKYNSNGDSLWVRRYDRVSQSDWILKVKADAFGNVFAAGHSINSSNNYDYFIIKYDAAGVHQWARFYNGTANQNDFFGGMDIDGSGNAYITVKSHSDLVSIKYDPAGNLQWLNKCPGAHGNAIKADLYGNVYVCGYAQDNFLTVKYNSTGDTVWTKMYDGGCSGNSSDFATSLAIDGSGNVFVTGSSIGCSGTNQDFATIKYNSNGQEQWVRRHYGASLTGSDYGKEILLDASGDVYVAGVSTEVYWQNFILLKYDKNGIQKWMKTYGNPGTSQLNDMVIDNRGNVYVTGSAPPSFNLTYSYLATVKYTQASTSLTALIEGFYDNNSGKMIPDTVSVYLRNTTSPFAVVDSARSILDSVGKGTFIFHSTSPGTSYFASVKHRNSVEVWSSAGILMSTGIMSYDFTSNSSQAYGNNLVLKGDKYCLFSGDCNQDGVIDGTDQMLIENSTFGTTTGYLQTDVNGDLITDGSDALIADNNAKRFVTAVSPLEEQMSENIQSNSNEKTSVINSISGIKLNDNYPNPFNPSTKISYEINSANHVTLKVYDITGKEVASLINEVQNAGKHSVTFNASGLTSGMYFYKLQTNGVSLVKKMMLIK